jgi:predicted amino acid racemase
VPTPYVTIDLDVIAANARAVVDFCSRYGIAVAGVTKGVCGDPAVARAMLRGGVTMIADSRISNLHRLRTAGVEAPIMLLRLPALSDVADVVALADISLNSELPVITALGEAAIARGVVHEVIVMVDLGDLREGVWPDDLVPFIAEARQVPGIRIIGLGANLACFAGVVPSAENMARMVALADAVEQAHGLGLPWLSGINSSALDVMESGDMPTRVNHARIGEAILLGRETTRREPWPGTRQDAFRLHAEVLELKIKPSRPIGRQAEDAFGDRPVFADQGNRLRALLNIGREDVRVEGVAPLLAGASVVGGSSGYLVLDVEDTDHKPRVGDVLAFAPIYGALLAAMTSPYVEKRYIGREAENQ